jgi:hypothetical protein
MVIMKPDILLACSYADIDSANLARLSLIKDGIAAEVTTCAIDLTSIIGVVLTATTSEEKLLKENPWIAKELHRSDETKLRVLPFIIYHSGKEKLDEIWDKNIASIYEHLFSDEFKPLAYDLATPELSNKELLRVLQLYYTK